MRYCSTKGGTVRGKEYSMVQIRLRPHCSDARIPLQSRDGTTCALCVEIETCQHYVFRLFWKDVTDATREIKILGSFIPGSFNPCQRLTNPKLHPGRQQLMAWELISDGSMVWVRCWERPTIQGDRPNKPHGLWHMHCANDASRHVIQFVQSATWFCSHRGCSVLVGWRTYSTRFNGKFLHWNSSIDLSLLLPRSKFAGATADESFWCAASMKKQVLFNLIDY